MNSPLDDLEPSQWPQDVGQAEDEKLHANADGAQSGGTRAFSATKGKSNLPKVQQEDAALTGHTATRTPQGQGQGITNHSMDEESARQEKVVSQRPDAQAGVDLTGHKVGSNFRPDEQHFLFCRPDCAIVYGGPCQHGW